MMNLKHLSSSANSVIHRCALKLDTSVDALLEEYKGVWKPELGDYSRKLIEYCCSKALRQGPGCGVEESISDSSFSRLTFDMMLAWQRPSSADEESYMECLGKEKEEKKPLKVNPPHEDVSLFYSDIMPLLVDHGQGVEEDAFVWFASILPLSGDVVNGRFIFETLTAPTANLLHYPAYDRFLSEIDKCMKHLQKQEKPKGIDFVDDEFILHVEGTANSQRVVRHIGGTSWPGRLTLTNYALYFEASGSVNYEDSVKVDLSKNIEQDVKPAATGPWGAPLFDKAMLYQSSELTEGVLLEFPELTSSTRRDHWMALTKEIILLHQFLSKQESLSAHQKWEMHARTVLGIVRLHAAREMLRMAPPLPQSFLIFTLFNELPKGDYIIEELAETLKLIDTGGSCSASSILRNLNMTREVTPDIGSIEPDVVAGVPLKSAPEDSSELEEPDVVDGDPLKSAQEDSSELKEPDVVDGDPLKSAQEESFATLDEVVTEVREQAREIKSAKATTEGLKEEGVVDSALVLLELLKPLKSSWIWLQEVLAWERPGATINLIAAILFITYKEWIGKALATILLWAVYEMLRARRQKIGDKYNKVVVCTATDQTAMESIVSAQQGLRNAHDLVQQVNIAILKMYSILASRAPKQANTVMMIMVGVALIVAVIPFKYLIMGVTLYLFAMNSKIVKNRRTTNDTGNRRLKEWWDSIPVIPVQIVDDPAECE
ncbi:hypothetical protein BVRB_5g109840 isoform A [Beta vulgaris subsp. vulgaris]|uniref:uncharacterized protein LOC104893398 n=1 Tax=Beta vulgaris subsp. vulgaris TaxID=3555 RepID=UPI0005403695|nr:uncharacterized protein LOC104893398 [Beta vulgaris subsp. vulgaris]KMT11301.1 hypothetical protein BVRB_5g109840 isoform A [Beta vulgaris subsp. vulgaris]